MIFFLLKSELYYFLSNKSGLSPAPLGDLICNISETVGAILVASTGTVIYSGFTLRPIIKAGVNTVSLIMLSTVEGK